MKTLAEISKSLNLFADSFGLPINGASQGSEAWFQLKLGVVSASNASKVVAKVGSETRATYMAELVAQIATGYMEEINSKYLSWGNDHEPAARSSYEFASGRELVEVPFVFKDESFRVGCSPDAIVPDLNTGIEIKCPYNSVHFIKFLTEDKLKPEYIWQNQFQMWVTSAEMWDAVQFDPRMKTRPMHVVTIERDEKAIKTLEDAVPQFLTDMDAMLEKAGVAFGDQWRRIAKANQAVAIAL